MKYKVPFVNPQKQYKDHKKEFLKTVDDVFSSGDLILRKDLDVFERKIAKLVGTKYAVGVNSGTDALSLSMEAAGLKEGDEVITVGHTFMASISAIEHQGAKPVLIDVGDDFNMNPDLLEKAISSKTAAIEPVHLNGRVCDMAQIMAVAKKHKLMIIEDAAQALGSKFKTKEGKWKMAGSFGLAGCFSMYPFKILGAFGDAGVVTTNDREIDRKVRLLRYNGEDRKKRKFYSHGYTALLDNVQAGLLNVKLKYFPKWIERRREIANLYEQGLSDIQINPHTKRGHVAFGDKIDEVSPRYGVGVKLPHFPDPRFFDVYQNYVLRAQSRDKLAAYLNKKGVETIISWPIPTYKQPIMQPNNIFLPETEKICKETLSLPMFPELANGQIKYVIKVIKDFYKYD